MAEGPADGTADGTVDGTVDRPGDEVIDSGRFRQAMGRLADGVAVVTTLAGRHHHAMTVTSVLSVSLDPLLVLVSAEVDGRWLDSARESGVFGVSLLGAGQRATAQWLAVPGRPLHDQLDRVPHRVGPRTGVALLEPALATLECRVRDIHPAGDHALVVGEVVHLGLAARPGPALVHYRGRFATLD